MTITSKGMNKEYNLSLYLSAYAKIKYPNKVVKKQIKSFPNKTKI